MCALPYNPVRPSLFRRDCVWITGSSLYPHYSSFSCWHWWKIRPAVVGWHLWCGKALWDGWIDLPGSFLGCWRLVACTVTGRQGFPSYRSFSEPPALEQAPGLEPVAHTVITKWNWSSPDVCLHERAMLVTSEAGWGWFLIFFWKETEGWSDCVVLAVVLDLKWWQSVLIMARSRSPFDTTMA